MDREQGCSYQSASIVQSPFVLVHDLVILHVKVCFNALRISAFDRVGVS